jgi:hypothetical protein
MIISRIKFGTGLFPFYFVKIFYHSGAMLSNFALYKEKIIEQNLINLFLYSS